MTDEQSRWPAEPGWYPDPEHRNVIRWFDGKQWTDDRQIPQSPEPLPDPDRGKKALTWIAWLSGLAVLAFVIFIIGVFVFMLCCYGGDEDWYDEPPTSISD